MQLARDLILCAALIGLLVIYWFMNKRNVSSQSGNQRGANKPVRRGARPPSPAATLTSPMASSASDDMTYEATQATAVLEDMYREFREELYAVHEKLDGLNTSWGKERSQLLLRLSQLERTVELASGVRAETNDDATIRSASASGSLDDVADLRPISRKPDKVVTTSFQNDRSSSFDLRYLEVLDRIAEGESLHSIAMDLGLDVEDVKMVQRIMSTPPSEVQ